MPRAVFLRNKKIVFLFGIFAVFALGTLYVVAPSNLGELTIDKCKNVTQGQEQCWEDLMGELMNRGGIAAALDTFAHLADTYEPFSGVCHSILHATGGEAYKQFVRGEDFIATPTSAYCDYGFYHGFMETLVSLKGGPKVAREFCAYIDQQLADVTPEVPLQCFHGIGHGWTNVHDNPELWGDERAIISRSIEACEGVKDTWGQLSHCLTGVFHGIANFYVKGDYGLSVNTKDPLWVCREQPERYRNECYMSMYGVLRYVTGDNFLQAARFIEDIDEDRYADSAIMHLAMSRSASVGNENDYINGITLCQALEARLRTPCIQGYAFGLFEHNTSGEGHDEPLRFCALAVLSQEQRRACLEYIFSYLSLWYPSEKVHHICATAEEQYRELCRSKLRG